jgi:predicted nucleic acid-binding protein
MIVLDACVILKWLLPEEGLGVSFITADEKLAGKIENMSFVQTLSSYQKEQK